MKMTKGEHLFTLMTMRLSGELTPGEAEELDRLIATDPAVKARWMELCRTFAPSDIANHFERLNEPKLPRRRAPRTLRFVLAAAAAAMVSGLVWWVATPVFRNREIARKNEAPLPGGVVLSTASGQTVNLSHPSSATLSGWQATTSAQTLNITTADDAAGWNRLSVPPGLTYRVILPDGSKIWLNSATSLQFPGTFPPPSAAYASREKPGW
ncbi:hypothetical protein [Chitinophaga caseinilytica]|uniref:Anti-sigma factor n=1 Tax=Chitinophaga caseinilytica TaxID=2267521 RepID=A0ABZ2Z734_9BACT